MKRHRAKYEMASTTRKALRKSLARWFSRSRRELPWRQTRDPYRIWVSEVMLQQTQVQTVLPYYSKFTKRFPNVESLSEASLDSILKSWEGLGYYARARNLHRAAKIVSSEMDGNLPDNYEALRALPGVGDYIASAVLSVAFDRAYAVVDGNVKRVLARLLTIDEPVNKSSSSKVFKAVAEQLLDGESPGDFNQAMMELGAIVCRSSKPNCAACPVNKFCKAFETGMQDAFPVRIRKRPVPTYHIAVGVVRRSGRILITRRKPTGFLGGLWEFPGGKVKPGESPEEACKREIKEEMNLSIDVGKHLTKVKHAYSHFKVSIDVFDCRYRAGSVRLNGPEDYRWIVLEEIDDYAFPGANHKFIPLLKEKKLSPSSNKELPKA